MTTAAKTHSLRRPPGPGPKLQITRDPSLRVREAVRDNNVIALTRLQHKTDLRNTDHNRLTSMSWAAIEGSLEVFEWLLLDYGHDDQELSRDADNNTILHLLASIPSPPTLSPHSYLLLSSPSFPPRASTRSIAEQTTISLRMTQLYHTLFPFLLDWSNSGGKTALHVAAQAGNAAFIQLLCDFGADVDLTDLQGNTPLHYASAWGHIETMRVLLDRGCQYSARNFEGFMASDFAYSNTAMASLQRMAREVFEERQTRKREYRGEVRAATAAAAADNISSGGLAGLGAGERFRSASVSTAASASGSNISSNPGVTSGSGSNVSSNYYRPSEVSRPSYYNEPHYSDRPGPPSRRPSDSVVPIQTYPLSEPPSKPTSPGPPRLVIPRQPPSSSTSAGRPQMPSHRSPSLPASGSPRPSANSAGPPILGEPINRALQGSPGSLNMRRANSTQLVPNMNSGALGPNDMGIRRAESGTDNRGFMM
ncbi:ankyrin repeat-containing domain protein [Naematelia encephala]|uniref:Ankyrin repeat-containing domain protein n=1 Tax=Naematelia encephala TaxID=71784 RepID=A0A1Y2BFW2_9TREE|nr:ankyrin repeat-containing domain protein [Naematelia encephala]